MQPLNHPPDHQYLPFQETGIREGISRKDILIADEMGLGKTIQAIGILNNIPWGRCLIVCPASLRLNWKHELFEWLVKDTCVISIPDKTLLYPFADVTIINYDKLLKFAPDLRKCHFDVIIYDESHYLKSPSAKRTKLCFGAKKVIWGDKRIFLTGTPILNRPIELFPLLKELGIMPNWKLFVYRYCDAKEKTIWTRNGKVTTLDTSGSSHESELQEILRDKIMIRRLKSEVLTELPAKIQQIIFLPENGGIADIKKERIEFAECLKNPNLPLAIMNLSELRQINALRKVKFAKEYIDNILEQTGKVVVFAWHKVVIEEIVNELAEYKPLKITGETSLPDRDKIVKEFQSGKSRVLVGNIKAAGVGLNLTAASNVVFIEMDWTPGNNTQAEDRIHRIGQNETCHIHYLVYEDTIDAFIAKKVAEKRKTIAKILDEKAEIEKENLDIEMSKSEVWQQVQKKVLI
jgi:SWI/SNF-related matrix-associated actin-dependent regulator 1 of chromatin subfamily A